MTRAASGRRQCVSGGAMLEQTQLERPSQYRPSEPATAPAPSASPSVISILALLAETAVEACELTMSPLRGGALQAVRRAISS